MSEHLTPTPTPAPAPVKNDYSASAPQGSGANYQEQAIAAASASIVHQLGYLNQDVLEVMKKRIAAHFSFASDKGLGSEEAKAILNGLAERVGPKGLIGPSGMVSKYTNAGISSVMDVLVSGAYADTYRASFNTAYDAQKKALDGTDIAPGPAMSTSSWERIMAQNAKNTLDASRDDRFIEFLDPTNGQALAAHGQELSAADYVKKAGRSWLGQAMVATGAYGDGDVAENSERALRWLDWEKQREVETKALRAEMKDVMKPMEAALAKMERGSPEWEALSDKLDQNNRRVERLVDGFSVPRGGFDRGVDAHSWALTQGADIVQSVGAVQQAQASAAAAEATRTGLISISAMTPEARALLGKVDPADPNLKILINQAEEQAKADAAAAAAAATQAKQSATAAANVQDYAQGANMTLEELRQKDPGAHARIVARYGPDAAAKILELAGGDPKTSSANLDHVIKMAQSEEQSSKSYTAAFSDAAGFDQSKLSPQLQGVMQAGHPLTADQVGEFTQAHKFYGSFENSLSPDGGTVEERRARASAATAKMWAESKGDVTAFRGLQKAAFDATPEVQQDVRSRLPGFKTTEEQMGYIKRGDSWQAPSPMVPQGGLTGRDSLAFMYRQTKDPALLKQIEDLDKQQTQKAEAAKLAANPLPRGRKM